MVLPREVSIAGLACRLTSNIPGVRRASRRARIPELGLQHLTTRCIETAEITDDRAVAATNLCVWAGWSIALPPMQSHRRLLGQLGASEDHRLY